MFILPSLSSNYPISGVLNWMRFSDTCCYYFVLFTLPCSSLFSLLLWPYAETSKTEIKLDQADHKYPFRFEERSHSFSHCRSVQHLSPCFTTAIPTNIIVDCTKIGASSKVEHLNVYLPLPLTSLQGTAETNQIKAVLDIICVSRRYAKMFSPSWPPYKSSMILEVA